jgi:uncharacterized lipoprotein YehR (DUF1307 family)
MGFFTDQKYLVDIEEHMEEEEITATAKETAAKILSDSLDLYREGIKGLTGRKIKNSSNAQGIVSDIHILETQQGVLQLYISVKWNNNAYAPTWMPVNSVIFID